MCGANSDYLSDMYERLNFLGSGDNYVSELYIATDTLRNTSA